MSIPALSGLMYGLYDQGTLRMALVLCSMQHIEGVLHAVLHAATTTKFVLWVMSILPKSSAILLVNSFNTNSQTPMMQAASSKHDYGTTSLM